MRGRAAPLLLLALSSLSCGGGRGSLPAPARPLVPTPDEAFRQRPPAAEPTRRAFRAPEISTERLENGLTLILWSRPNTPVTAVRYVTARGGEDSPRDQAGRAWLVGRILELSTGADEIEGGRSLEAAGFDASVSVDLDQASLSVQLEGSRLAEAVGLVANTVRRPVFSATRVGEARQDTLDLISRSSRVPERSALHWAKAMLYGLDHRGALPLWGSATSVREVTRAELMARHYIGWGPQESALVVVGNHQPEELHELALEAFGDWVTETPPRPEPEPWVALDSPNVARAMGIASSSPPSVVLLVERAPGRAHRDHPVFQVLSLVLAGLRSSWLNGRLREECPTCSSAGVFYDARLGGGELVLTVESSRRQLAQVLEAVQEELDRLIEQGPEEQELAAARAVARQRMISSLERSSDAASTLGELFVLGAQPSDVVGEVEELESISAEQVRAVAARWLRPQRAPLVVTGNLDAISLAFNVNSIGPAMFRSR